MKSRMNDRSMFTWEKWTATYPNPTATPAWPRNFAVLLSPSDRWRAILMRSSNAPTIPRPTATPSTDRPARVNGVRTLARR